MDLDEIIARGSDQQRRDYFPKILETLENGDPTYANIASDWLRYGRFGIETNVEEANKYLDMGVKSMNPDSIYDYAFFLDGDSREERMEAFPYYLLSAILGNCDSVEMLSDYYLYGENVSQNDFVSGALRKHMHYLKANK